MKTSVNRNGRNEEKKGEVIMLKSNDNTRKEEENYGVGESPFTSSEILKALYSHEDGDRFLFVNLLKNKICYDHAQKKWFVLDADCWKKTIVDSIYKYTGRVVEVYKGELKNQEMQAAKTERVSGTLERNIKELKKRIRALHFYGRIKKIISTSRAKSPVGLGITGKTQWQIPPEWFPCKNKILSLDSLESRNKKPEDYINEPVPTNWNPTAVCPRWEKFMLEIFEGDQEMVDYMQRVLGYALSGTCREKVGFVFHGRNSKEVMLGTIKYVLGPLVYKVNPRILKWNIPSPSLLGLRGKRIAWWANQISADKALEAINKKEEISRGILAGKTPYNNIIEFESTHTLFMLMDDMPKASANARIRERVQTIDFKLSFVDDPVYKHERKADVNLQEEILKEAEGILAWMVRGYQEYQRVGLNPPKKVLNDNDDQIGSFIGAKCVLNAARKVQARTLYNAYNSWCTATGHKAISETKFGKDMKTRFDSKRSNGRYYLGLELITS